MTLKDGKVNVEYVVKGYEGKVDSVARRFMELGLVSGEKVKIISTSLQKKVFLIEIRGYLLSVRSALLSCVRVEG